MSSPTEPRERGCVRFFIFLPTYSLHNRFIRLLKFNWKIQRNHRLDNYMLTIDHFFEFLIQKIFFFLYSYWLQSGAPFLGLAELIY